MTTESRMYNNYWKDLVKDNASPMTSVTLNKKQDTNDFQIYGNRLASRLLLLLEEFQTTPFREASILEIGCGMGRFIVPFSKHFQTVFGVDISNGILEECKKYCDQLEITNYRVFKNNGSNLDMFDDESLDYCFSGGVFQHITYIESIINYIKEALRTLRTGGIFLFQFFAFHKNEIGSKRVGAKITAAILDEKLADCSFKILDISCDPYDPMRPFIVIIQKIKPNETKTSFKEFEVRDFLFRTGCHKGLANEIESENFWKQKKKRITFYD